jgi:hypothetical protein
MTKFELDLHIPNMYPYIKFELNQLLPRLQMNRETSVMKEEQSKTTVHAPRHLMMFCHTAN